MKENNIKLGKKANLVIIIIIINVLLYVKDVKLYGNKK